MLVGTEMAAAIALLDPVSDRRRSASTARPARARWASTCACSARRAASADLRAAQRRPAAARRRQAALPADARGARRLARRASSTEDGVNIVGGCCGTTPAHMAAVVQRLGARAPKPRKPAHRPQVTSIYSRRAARAGQLDPVRRRALQRQRLARQFSSTCSSRRRRRHGRDGPRAGARGQPRARRLHRLRRPRRGRRHDAA